MTETRADSIAQDPEAKQLAEILDLDNPTQVRWCKAFLFHRRIIPACNAAGIHNATLYSWKKKDPKFLKAYDAVFAMRNAWLEDQVQDTSQIDPPTLRWLASRLMPETYGDPRYRQGEDGSAPKRIIIDIRDEAEEADTEENAED